MGRSLRKLFNLLPGEGKKAWLFSFLGFFWSFGAYGCLTLSEGMFLENIGVARLPLVYFFLAASMCAISALLIFAIHRLSIHRLLIAICSLTTFVYFATALYCIYVPSPPENFWYFFRIMGTVFLLSIYVVNWAFIDQYYDLQDGKRIFCLIGAVLFLGDACAGATISLALEAIGSGGLLFVFLSSIALTLPLIAFIVRTTALLPEAHTEGMDSNSEISFKSFLSTLFRSRFTLILMLFYFLMQILAITTEFSYFDAVETVYGTSHAHAVTEFLGRTTAWVSLGNMIFGLFFYSRLAKKIGVNNIVIVAPLFFFIVFFLWSFESTLAVAVLGIIAREGMTYTFDDNNLNLLVSAVPTRVKNQVRIIIESFFEPFGIFLSGLLLLALQNQSKLLGLSLAVGALVLACFLRSSYPKAIFQNLMETRVRFARSNAHWLKRFSKKERERIEYLLIRALKKKEEKQSLLAFEGLILLGDTSLLPRLLTQLGPLTLKGKLQLIEIFADSPFAQHPLVIGLLRKWQKTFPHPTLHHAVHLYFARYGLLPLTPKEIEEHLESCCDNKVSIAIKILGHANNEENVRRLLPYLSHASPLVAKAAARAISSLAHPETLDSAASLIFFLPRLFDTQTRSYLLTAIEKCQDPASFEELILVGSKLRPAERKHIEIMIAKSGNQAESLLHSIVRETKYPHQARLLAGKILARISSASLKQLLPSLLSHEIDQAYFYLYHGRVLQQLDPEFTYLKNALLTYGETLIDFLVQLLGIAHKLEDPEVLAHTLRSKNRKLQAQTFETIEKICERKIYLRLEPLINQRERGNIFLFYHKNRPPITLSQLIEKIQEAPSPAIKMISLSFQEKQNLSRDHFNIELAPL